MCRDNAHGGRRCPGDNANARRARRYARASAAAAGAAAATSARTAPPVVPIEIERPQVDVLAEQAADLRDLPLRVTAMREKMLRLQTEMDDAGLPASERNDRLLEAWEAALDEHDLRRYTDADGNEIIQRFTGGIRFDVLEGHVARVGAETNTWLDSQLIDEHRAYREAADAAAEVSRRVDEARETYRQELHRRIDGESDEARSARVGRASDAAGDLIGRLSAATDARQDTRNAYYAAKRRLIGQLRPMGANLEWTTAGVSTPKRVDEEIQRAAAMLPADWIERSNTLSAADGKSSRASDMHGVPGPEVRPVRVRESKRRAHYTGAQAVKKRTTSPSLMLYSDKSADDESIATNPRLKVIAPDDWPETYRSQYLPVDGTLIQDCDVAYPGYRDWSTGRIIVAEDGTLAVSGRAASGWERHEYTDGRGDPQVCWRRPKKIVTTNWESGTAELTIPPVRGSSTSLHELTHRCENVNPMIGRLEQQFLLRRTTGEDGQRQESEAYHATLRRERVRPDSFIDRYIGKDYSSSTYHEVMSVGNEVALMGAMGGFGKLDDDNAQRDDDHHAFVLGTLLVA